MPDRKTLFFAALVFIAITIALFLLSASGWGISDLYDIDKLFQILNAILSFNIAAFFSILTFEFIAFLLVLPLAYAFAIMARKESDYNETIVICSVAAAAATAVSLVLFQNLLYYWIIAVFFVASIPMAMYYSSISLKELKKYIVFRAINGSIHKGVLLISLGVLIFGFVVLLPETEKMATQFEYGMIETMTGDNLGGIQSMDLSEQLADALILQQNAMLDQVIENAVFEKLREKTDSDVITFVLLIDTLKQEMQTPEYKELIKEQIRQNQGSAIEDAGIDSGKMIEIMKEQFPIMKIVEKGFWLMLSIALIGIIQLLALIIIGPLGALYGLLFSKLTEEETGPEEKKTQTRKKRQIRQF